MFDERSPLRLLCGSFSPGQFVLGGEGGLKTKVKGSGGDASFKNMTPRVGPSFWRSRLELLERGGGGGKKKPSVIYSKGKPLTLGPPPIFLLYRRKLGDEEGRARGRVKGEERTKTRASGTLV